MTGGNKSINSLSECRASLVHVTPEFYHLVENQRWDHPPTKHSRILKNSAPGYISRLSETFTSVDWKKLTNVVAIGNKREESHI